MKFKDKDGNVFEDINSYVIEGFDPLLEWITEGKKLVEEYVMNNEHKLRICEVLGVEVGERFNISYPNRVYDALVVRPDGKVWETGRTTHKLGTNALYYLIEHPEAVVRRPRTEEKEELMKQDKPCRWCCDEICTNADSPMLADYCPVPDTPDVCRHEDRTPRFTEEEVAAAKAIKVVYPKAKKLEFVPRVISVYSDEGVLAHLSNDLFPSIRPGQIVELSDIIGDAP